MQGDRTSDYRRIRVEPLTVHIGSEVLDVDLADIDAPTFAEIRAAFLSHKVLFFRRQSRLDRSAQVALGRRFGELMRPNVMADKTEHPEIYVLKSGADSRPTTDCWHVDSTYMSEPAMMSILRALQVPQLGGDTLWADMEAAYEALPADLRQRIDGLRSVNSISKLKLFAGYDERVGAVESSWPAVEHPIVRTHPDTGRRSVFINQMTATGVSGLESDAAERLLAQLYALAANPEYQCRWRWQADDVAMWDNRCTQHYAVCDYLPASRLMERVTVRGTRPV
jgi:taurine dioxygenase